MRPLECSLCKKSKGCTLLQSPLSWQGTFFWKKTMSFLRQLLPLLLSLIAGSITACAFAPWHRPELALLGILVLICLWRRQKSGQAFWTGLFFGLGEFGTGVSWIQISIHNFGGTTLLISVLVAALFVLYLSLFPAFTGYIWTKIRRNQFPALSYLVLLPSLWVLLDWTRGVLFSGFPWLFPGYAFLDLPLRGWAPLLSVYGVSWLGICSVSVLFLLLNQRNSLNSKRVISYTFILVIAWLGGWGLSSIHWTHPTAPAQRAAMVQGNIPFEQKWSMEGIKSSIRTYLGLTQELAEQNDIVIWPETAISVNQDRAQLYLNGLQAYGAISKTAIVSGLIWSEDDGDGAYNAMTALGWKSDGTYLKRHLVPFGEYEPYPAILGPIFKALDIPMSMLSAGPMTQDLLTVAGNPVAAFICYEISYPSLVLRSAEEAAWLLTLSDDSWFGHSWAGAQQLQMAQMRSLESGRDMAYATSNGITAFIDSQGNIAERAPRFVQTTLSGTVQARAGLTPISYYQPTSILALMMIALIIGVYVCTGTKRD
jgi:apolipoprotein N-acyltransferase